MNLASLLAVLGSLACPAPGVSTQEPDRGHAALHPAEALVFVELPDVQGAWRRAPQAPLARIAYDPRVLAAVEALSGQPLSAWLARPESTRVLEPLASFTRDLRALSFSCALADEEGLVERSTAQGFAPLREIGIEADLEYAPQERAGEVLAALDALLAAAGDLQRRQLPDDPPGAIRFGNDRTDVFAWAEGRLLRIGLGAARAQRMRARGHEGSLAASEPVAAAAARLQDSRGALTVRGVWRTGAWALAKLAELAGAAAGAGEARSIERLAELAAADPARPGGPLAFQLRQLERGFVWESFQAGTAPASIELGAPFAGAPSDAVIASTTTIDAVGCWELAGLFTDTSGLERSASEAGIDLRRDLLGPLGPGFALCAPPINGLAPRVELRVELSDPERFERALVALAQHLAEVPDGAAGPSLSRTAYRGHQLTTLEPSGASPLRPTFAVVDGELLVMTQPGHLKRFLRGAGGDDPSDGAGFAERADVAPRLAALGEGKDVASVTFVDWGAILVGYYRSGQGVAQLALGGQVDLLEALPPEEIFTQHLHPTWRVARSVAGGTHVLKETPFGPELPLAALGGIAVLPAAMRFLPERR